MSTYEISKSSLLSLKAEILRKQDEVTKAKLRNKAKAECEPKKSTPLELKNKGVSERAKADEIEEDEDLLKKSRDVLEAKSKLYERLEKGEKKKGSDRFLVQFGRKLTYAKPPDDSESEDYDRHPESDEEKYDSDEYRTEDPGDQWVEFTDCLGRTRKCLRRDLRHIKAKDSELKATMRKKEEEKKPEEKVEKERNDFDENNELLSNDMRTELLRRKWEKEEDELTKKSDVHYQDILFDEARVHGVGYYAFSKNERERSRQQDALKKLREETQKEQQKAEEKRKLRDAQLAARAKAARNRKRARAGLPPEEEKSEEEEDESQSVKDLEENVEKIPQKSEEELKREELRKKHVRPWDLGKDGVRDEMTQEEWVRKKRKERDEEFAPPSLIYENQHKKFPRDFSKPPPTIKNPYKNPKASFVRRPILNECSSSSEDSDDSRNPVESQSSYRGRGVEIAPPTTLDHYRLSDDSRNKKANASEDILDSIAAGLKFMRQQVEKKGRNRDDEMFIM